MYFLFLMIYLFLCVITARMPVHPVCFISMGWSEEGTRFFGTRVTDVRCQECAGNQSLVLWRNNKCPQTAELSLQPPGIFLNVVHLQIYGFPMASNSWLFMVWAALYGAILTDVNSLLNVAVLSFHRGYWALILSKWLRGSGPHIWKCFHLGLSPKS